MYLSEMKYEILVEQKCYTWICQEWKMRSPTEQDCDVWIYQERNVRSAWEQDCDTWIYLEWNLRSIQSRNAMYASIRNATKDLPLGRTAIHELIIRNERWGLLWSGTVIHEFIRYEQWDIHRAGLRYMKISRMMCILWSPIERDYDTWKYQEWCICHDLPLDRTARYDSFRNAMQGLL